jgi:hypothetical protein
LDLVTVSTLVLLAVSTTALVLLWRFFHQEDQADERKREAAETPPEEPE